MTSSLPLLADDEVARGRPDDDRAGAGALVTERGNLPLRAVDVHAEITGLLARTTLSQTFANPFDQPLEATYVFPLPDRAAVTEFRMEVAGRVVEGVLRERAEARASYDRAVREGRRAAIAEEERPGVFTMRVGNLMPGEQASVRLVMTGPLPYDQGEATFRFPLVVAPRYIPGAALPGEPAGDGTVFDTDAVPDASRIRPPVLLPGFPSPVRLSIEVEVDPAGLDLGDLRSSLHAVVAEERDGASGRVWVVRVEPGDRLDRDFVLRLPIASDGVATSLAVVPDQRGDAGTFALTVVPPPATDESRPRDLVFVLDRSGSMTGWKIVAARRAVARMIDSLTERDRFTLLAFDNLIESPPAPDAEAQPGGPMELLPGSDRNRFRAVEFLSRLGARGGTEVAGPLMMAADCLAHAEPPGRDRVLVLVTDGQVGNEDQILRGLAPQLGDVRVYTVGIDTAVNEGFLKRLAGLGGGACELVESEDRLDDVMDRVRQRIGAPVVTDLQLDSAGIELDRDTVAPARLPALLAGAPLLISGRYRGDPQGALALVGSDAAGREWRAVVSAAVGGNPALASVWARAHLRDLEDRYASGKGDPDLERRIVKTSLDHGVLCRFTAFVAVDTSVVNQEGQRHRVTQPVELPQGWELPGLLGPEPTAASDAMVSFTSAPLARMPSPRLPLSASGGGRPARAPLRRTRAKPATPGGLSSADSAAGLGADPAAGPRDAEASPASPARRPFWKALTPPATGGRWGPGAAAPGALGGAGLAAYRRRARELARRLEAAPPAGLAWQLGVTAVRLRALVADLESVGADEREVAPLRELAADLARAPSGETGPGGTAGPGPGGPCGAGASAGPTGPGDLAGMRERALAVLLAFAGASA